MTLREFLKDFYSPKYYAIAEAFLAKNYYYSFDELMRQNAHSAQGVSRRNEIAEYIKSYVEKEQIRQKQSEEFLALVKQINKTIQAFASPTPKSFPPKYAEGTRNAAIVGEREARK